MTKHAILVKGSNLKTIGVLKQNITNRMVSDQMADEMLEDCLPLINDYFNEYRVTWYRPADEYPPVMHNMIWQLSMPIFFNWIEEHQPQAWFKPLFNEELMVEILESQKTDHYETGSQSHEIDEATQELLATHTQVTSQSKYNNDPCIQCGSRALKAGRICPNCWL